MNKETLLAFMVWAMDVDALHLPVTRALEMFKSTAEKIKKTYTNPDDELLFCPNLKDKSPIEIMTDYTLFYARARVFSGIESYGKYDTLILNYKKS